MLKIFLIDNLTETGNYLKSVIRNCEGVEFIGQSQRGLAGIQIINEHRPDVVIIDLNIPGTNGFDLLSWIKENYPNTKVIMISNTIKVEYRLISESLGADFFIDMQTEMDTLTTVIKSIALFHNQNKEKEIINVIKENRK